MPEGNEQPQRYCQNCGAEVRPGTSFCVSCGKSLFQEPESSSNTFEAPSPSGSTGSFSNTLRRVFSMWMEDFRSNFDSPRQESESKTIVDQGQQSTPLHQPRTLREETRSRQHATTSLASAEALDQAIEHMVTRTDSPNFTVANKAENSVTFSNYQRANVFIAALFLAPAIIYLLAVPPLLFNYLNSGRTVTNQDFNFVILLFLCLPMVFYFMVGGKHLYSTLTARPLPSGCRLIVSGESAAGYEQLTEWANSLPDPEWSETATESFPEPQAPAIETDKQVSQTPDSLQQIRKLAELRDAGILTDEEFNAKKSQLLDRM